MSESINFFINKVRFKVEDKKLLILWIKGVIDSFEKVLGNINFILTSDKELNEINIKYLNADTYTDVVTFTFSEESNIISGDVYISIDRVKDNSIRYKVSIQEELRRILIHGTLHLIGYNDLSKNEKRRMTRLENKFLGLYKEV
jgi:probable rRNA maturation factor